MKDNYKYKTRKIQTTYSKGTYFDTKKVKPQHAKGGGRGGDDSPNSLSARSTRESLGKDCIMKIELKDYE